MPRWLQKTITRLRGQNIYFDGPFTSWEIARGLSSGYDDSRIVQKVLQANRKVRNGKAAFARDGVTFDQPSFRWPVLTSLLQCTNPENGRLNVIDFGGSLGEFFMQHKIFLGCIDENGWRVVEQQKLVEIGEREFGSGLVKFYESIQKAAEKKSDVLLLSAVLQYLQQPFEVIEAAGKLDIKTIVIDRTPVSERSNDQVFVQNVPASIYRASYPSWVFSETGLSDRVAMLGYSVFCRFSCPERTHLNCRFMGYVLKKTD